MAGPLDDGLDGSVAVVTGGASGIGATTAELLRAAGARVFVADLNQGDGPARFVRTDVTDTPLPEKLRGALQRAIPLGRPATPQKVAQAILFFASRRSEYVTGQTLSVSGGLTMA